MYSRTYLYTRDWQVWKNTDGVTTTLRTHLKQQHGEEYERIASALKLKHADNSTHPTLSVSRPHGPFELEEWIKLLIKWIVVDDQVCYPISSRSGMKCFTGYQRRQKQRIP